MAKTIKAILYCSMFFVCLTIAHPSQASMQSVDDPVCELPSGRPTHQVPEPSSLLLLGIGLSGLALARKFKR